MFKLVFRLHAVQRMFFRSITEEEVRFVIENGQAIESYDQDTPYPSKLILGKFGLKILHVVVAFNKLENELIVVTVYEPDPHLWEDNFKTRRQK
jgi:hypothetical protein